MLMAAGTREGAGAVPAEAEAEAEALEHTMSDVDSSLTARAPAAAGRFVHGVLGEFADVHTLMAAARRVRDAGFRQWDAHTPFPVHGLDRAMGVRATRLPWIIMLVGLAGCGLGILMPWWMNAVDYPYVISGKPLFSLPAYIPVVFEVTVLLSALTAFLGALGLNRLPELFSPLSRSVRFRRATDDRFFIFLDRRDRLFNEAQATELLHACHAGHVETIATEPLAAQYRIPKVVVGFGVAIVLLSLIPFAVAARARFATSDKPRIHIVPDMDSQPSLQPQAASNLFADGRAMRAPVDGTVARGELFADAALYRGRSDTDGSWVNHFPASISVTRAFVERGRERYQIFCSPCHGQSGAGDGLVSQRAEMLGEGTWVAPTPAQAESVRVQPLGQLFDTITNGVRNMPAHGSQISVRDRWAIVAYLKALQLSAATDAASVPPDVLRGLQ